MEINFFLFKYSAEYVMVVTYQLLCIECNIINICLIFVRPLKNKML